MMTVNAVKQSAGLLSVLLACVSAHAQPSSPDPVPTTQPHSIEVTYPFATPVDLSQLANLRGASEQVNAQIKLIGTTAGNTAEHVITGNNAITGGSFANMNGLPVVIQNTGANVLIQNAVILQLQMK